MFKGKKGKVLRLLGLVFVPSGACKRVIILLWLHCVAHTIKIIPQVCYKRNGVFDVAQIL